MPEIPEHDPELDIYLQAHKNLEVKLEPPQPITETGVAGDYVNEISALMNSLDLANDAETAEMVYEIFHHNVDAKGRLFYRYGERYPGTEYTNVVTDKNRHAVEQLNQLADECNQIFKEIDCLESPTFEKVCAIKEKLLPKFKQMERIIFGNSREQSALAA